MIVVRSVLTRFMCFLGSNPPKLVVLKFTHAIASSQLFKVVTLNFLSSTFYFQTQFCIISIGFIGWTHLLAFFYMQNSFWDGSSLIICKNNEITVFVIFTWPKIFDFGQVLFSSACMCLCVCVFVCL